MPEFKILEVRECDPRSWFVSWSAKYKDPIDVEKEYAALISLARQNSFPPAYFERVGKWKDSANSDGRWKPNVASVAYLIWRQAEDEQPRCPTADLVVSFLEDWSARAYKDVFPAREVKKQFGLSRATTLLHFVSGGKFPIYDSNVIKAIGRLYKKKPLYTANYYWETFYAQFLELAALCQTDDFRRLDNALFSYGSSNSLV
jgi:hypothetical protein